MVIEIEDNVFLSKLYKGLKKQTNQGVFVTNFFIACGSNHFPRLNKSADTSDTETQRSLLKSGKHITAEMKASFPREINLQNASDFLFQQIDEYKLNDLFLSYGLPSSIKKEPKLIAMALIVQFELFIKSDGYDVENIILSEYQKILQSGSKEETREKSVYYPGDKIYLKNLTAILHTLNCYQESTHTWELSNSGTQEWTGRKLVLINQGDISPKFIATTVEIPNTPPSMTTTVSVEFDSRGQEGMFDCHWEMWDSDGNNCFPNNNCLLDIRLCVKFDYR